MKRGSRAKRSTAPIVTGYPIVRRTPSRRELELPDRLYIGKYPAPSFEAPRERAFWHDGARGAFVMSITAQLYDYYESCVGGFWNVSTKRHLVER
jgi:hypothetical protein